MLSNIVGLVIAACIFYIAKNKISAPKRSWFFFLSTFVVLVNLSALAIRYLSLV
ncbi:hypothetical protein [Paenibacillus terrae]|uniref:hypothetical protein n=1 Tax=Paenibacillus terrae TaxID=159743 RepID=UPI000AEE1043|nr:hypothetical protein [Paenibacillus terrae]